jgi:hypothetical protein
MVKRFTGGGHLIATSIYGAKNRRGLVDIQLGETVVTVIPQDARDFALNLLGCAEAAESDEFMVAFFTGKVGLDESQVVPILREFRELRNQRHREDPPKRSEPIEEDK